MCVHNNEILEHIDGDLELPIVAFLIHGDHAYFYNQKGARVIHKRFKVTSGGSSKDRLKHTGESKVPPPSQWERWVGDIRDGHFGVDPEDVTSIRSDLLARGKLPRVTLKDQCTFKSLSLPCGKGTCHIHVYPTDCFEIELWLKRLPCEIAYRGESMPCISLKVLSALVKHFNERIYLTGDQRAELLERYEFRCAHCYSMLSKIEWDHIARLSDNPGDQ